MRMHEWKQKERARDCNPMSDTWVVPLEEAEAALAEMTKWADHCEFGLYFWKAEHDSVMAALAAAQKKYDDLDAVETALNTAHQELIKKANGLQAKLAAAEKRGDNLAAINWQNEVEWSADKARIASLEAEVARLKAPARPDADVHFVSVTEPEPKRKPRPDAAKRRRSK